MHIAPIVYEPDHNKRRLVLRLRRRQRTSTMVPRIIALKMHIALAAFDQDFPNGCRIFMTSEGTGALDPVAAAIMFELEIKDYILEPGIDFVHLERARWILEGFPAGYYRRVREVLLAERPTGGDQSSTEVWSG